MKICIFPNDPIKAYFEKGEIKNRYYNPNNLFDEVHFISLTEHDIEESKVQKLVGNANMKIHSVGKISLMNRNKEIKKIFEIIKEIKPDALRAYNPLLEGWLAAKCAEKFNIPLFISLHTQYDHNRQLAKKNNFKKYLAMKYTEKFIEPFVLQTANKITIIYKIIQPYVINHSSKNPEILHNKIDCSRFANGIPIDTISQPLILSVGNLISVKNHQLLIKAMKGIDGKLLIIGNGELYSKLNELIIEYGVQNKVSIKKSVPHEKIQNYYKSAKIFALAYNTEVESLPMPVMEAMATGLPVVIPFPKEGYSEGLEETAIFSKNNVLAFTNNIKKLLESKDLMEKYSKKSLEKAKEFDIDEIEHKESEIYLKLIRETKNE
jgi:glycosyltransferase involved in cell wall biosynthesis